MNTTGGSHTTGSRSERQAPYEIAFMWNLKHDTEEPRTGRGQTLQSMRVTVRRRFPWVAVGSHWVVGNRRGTRCEVWKRDSERQEEGHFSSSSKGRH